MRVIAIKRGYYAGRVQDEGDEFSLERTKDFSKSWMKKVPKTKAAPKKAPAKTPAPTGATAGLADIDVDPSNEALSAAERMAMANSLTERTDITTVDEANAILVAAKDALQ